MSIYITYDRGVYEVNGLLNSQNGESLKEHLECLMMYSKGVVLSLNKVVGMDINAAKMIWELYRRSCVSDTLFYIIGIKNQKVKELFNRLNYDDILL